MAYAGTPTGLAQQTGSSSSKTLLTAIAVLAIGLATVIAVLLFNGRAVAPAADRGDDQIEAQRGVTVAGTALNRTAQDNARGAFAPAAVTQTAIEKAAAAKAGAMSGVPAALKPYEVDERPRGAAPASATGYDPTWVDGKLPLMEARGAHGPLP